MSDENSSLPVSLKESTTPATGVIRRLASFGNPRDLTLGGFSNSLKRDRGGVSKKVYAPNLNVTRNKNTNVKTSKDTTRNLKRNEQSKPKSERTKKEGNLMQTTGIFSEGIAASTIKKSSESYPRSTEEIRKPTITKTKTKVDEKSEILNLKSLLGDEDENDIQDSFKKIDIKYKPVKLGKENDLAESNVGLNENPITKECFESNLQKMFLVQFPDILPCENNPTRRCEDGNESTESKTNEVKEGGDNSPVNITTNLEEGQIGRLVRYKSGKCKLILGKTKFDLNVGLETGFLQEVVSISTKPEERSGDVVKLGAVNTKLIVSPDWDSLLEKK